MLKRLLLLAACGVLAAVPAYAGNGHFLHGVGAVNSSLGGAGTGLAFETIGALHANPALLTQLTDNNVAISAEVFSDDLSATTSGGGLPTETNHSNGQLGILPALGWSIHPPGKNYAFGFGLLAVAGFRTNFPVDNASLLNAGQPPGFGRLATDLAVTKIPVAFAWQATPKLSLGLALDLFQGALVIQPLPVVVPDCTDPTIPPFLQPAACYRPGTSGQVTSYAVTPQAGFYYQLNPVWSVGASYTVKQSFPEYRWNSAHANPFITSGPNAFGNPRKIGIVIDGPPIASFGIGIQPNPKLKIAVDARWVGYHSTAGIGGSGGINQNLQLVSIGWQDIWVGMAGVQWQATPKLTLRAGLNFNQSPIKSALTLNSGGTPSVFEQHYCLGASVAVLPHFDVDLGFYYTPSNSKTGPFIGVSPPATITLTNSITSGLAGFSFHF
jgi:long-chain fatty acid transport protein